MDSHKKWRSTLEEQEQERLRRWKRKPLWWHALQEREKEHEKRKKKMIEEYEEHYKRKRAEAIEKKKSLHESRSKSSSPQRRKTSSPEQSTSKERRASVIGNGPEGIFIDKKELQKIEISICKKNSLPTEDQSMSDKIERDIINLEDIILPRRQNEGKDPIFQKSEIKNIEEIRKITFTRNEPLVSDKQLSTSRKNVYIRRRPDDDITQHYGKRIFSISLLQKMKEVEEEEKTEEEENTSSNKKTIRRDDRDDDRYNRDRKQSGSIRNSKEKDRARSEKRDSSTSRSSSHSASLSRNHSRSRYRSRSHSPISKQTKERRDNDKNKFSSKRSYPDQSRKLDNRVAPKQFTNYPLPNSFYNDFPVNPYMARPIPRIPMPRIQPLHVFVPVLPGPQLPAPMNVQYVSRWRPPPPLRFINGRGTGFWNAR